MGRAKLVIPLAVVLSLATAPSLAADQTVHAGGSSFAFSPSTVTIAPGEAVTFVNDGGTHNVDFDDGSFKQPAAPSSSSWTVRHDTLKAPGTYRYHCDQHGSAGGGGMSGTVIVQEPGGGGGDTTAPAISLLKVSPTPFCNKASDKCPKRGARLKLTLSEVATVTGTIIRRKDGVKVGSLSFAGKAGKNDRTFKGKGLANGKYRVDLVAEDAAGNRSPVAKASFKIAAKR